MNSGFDKAECHFEVPGVVPNSDIIHMCQHQADVKQQALFLSDKYIQDLADSCINVPFVMKMDILTKMDGSKSAADDGHEENAKVSANNRSKLQWIFNDNLEETAGLLDDAGGAFGQS